MNLANMMKQAQMVQKRLQDAQRDLANTEIPATAGNGAVTVNGGIQIISSVAATGVTAIPDNVTTVSGIYLLGGTTLSLLFDLLSTTSGVKPYFSSI